MIVDTSAVVAYVRREETAVEIERLLVENAPHQMSAATRVELGLVLGAALDEEQIDRVLDVLRIAVVALTPAQARLASEAHRRYGRGNHPARLNLGDMYSYTLAAESDGVLLCTGNDFAQTDIVTAP